MRACRVLVSGISTAGWLTGVCTDLLEEACHVIGQRGILNSHALRGRPGSERRDEGRNRKHKSSQRQIVKRLGDIPGTRSHAKERHASGGLQQGRLKRATHEPPAQPLARLRQAAQAADWLDGQPPGQPARPLRIQARHWAPVSHSSGHSGLGLGQAACGQGRLFLEAADWRWRRRACRGKHKSKIKKGYKSGRSLAAILHIRRPIIGTLDQRMFFDQPWPLLNQFNKGKLCLRPPGKEYSLHPAAKPRSISVYYFHQHFFPDGFDSCLFIHDRPSTEHDCHLPLQNRPAWRAAHKEGRTAARPSRPPCQQTRARPSTATARACRPTRRPPRAGPSRPPPARRPAPSRRRRGRRRQGSRSGRRGPPRAQASHTAWLRR